MAPNAKKARTMKPDEAGKVDCNSSGNNNNRVSWKDYYRDCLKVKQEAAGCYGIVQIVGIRRDEEDEEKYEDMYATVRFVPINESRKAALDEALDLVTCGQGNFAMFTTSTGNHICETIPGEVLRAMSKKSLPEKFDHLFALTFYLEEYCWSWMEDNEYGGPGDALDQSFRSLEGAWRKMLKHSNAKLGIDADFTRPGIEALLGKFEEASKRCPTVELEYLEPFKWR